MLESLIVTLLPCSHKSPSNRRRRRRRLWGAAARNRRSLRWDAFTSYLISLRFTRQCCQIYFHHPVGSRLESVPATSRGNHRALCIVTIFKVAAHRPGGGKRTVQTGKSIPQLSAAVIHLFHTRHRPTDQPTDRRTSQSVALFYGVFLRLSVSGLIYFREQPWLIYNIFLSSLLFFLLP